MSTPSEFQIAVAQLLEIPPEQLALDTALDRFETWDSLAVISVVALVTEHFGVTVSADTVRKAKTLSDVLDGVMRSRTVPPAAAVSKAASPSR
jgi:acyl carrier protein